MNSQHTLYVHRESISERLTLGWLRQHITPGMPPLWISLEPRAWLPERDGRRQSGRLLGVAPLARCLPDGLDDMPLLTASLYEHKRWRHFHDAHPLSQLSSQCITWSLEPMPDFQMLEGLHCSHQKVLTWQDRKRFGLSLDNSLPEELDVEHYYQNGQRLTWRLLTQNAEAYA